MSPFSGDGDLTAHGYPEAPLAERVKRHMIRVVAVLAYLAVGVVFYTSVTADVVEGVTWSFTEALYFVVVTMSTVGYGDLSIYQSSDGAKYFTAAFVIVGIIVAFEYTGQLYDGVVGSIGSAARQSLPVCRRCCGLCCRRFVGPEKPKRSKHEKWADVQVQPAWRFYTQELLPSLAGGVCFNIFFAAYIFTRTQPDLSYGDASPGR